MIFWQICHFDVKVTEWVDLKLSPILTQTVERYMSDLLHRYTNIGKAEIFHV